MTPIVNVLHADRRTRTPSAILSGGSNLPVGVTQRADDSFRYLSFMRRAAIRAVAGGVKTGRIRGMVNAIRLLVVMFLSSCASGQPLGSYEPQTQRDYNRDLYECEREATFAQDSKQQVFDSCMKARGYVPSPAERFEWPHTQ